MNIGTACKQIAKSKRISAAEISRNTGIAQSYLSMLFNGRIDDPQVRRIYLICRELRITVDELIEYAETNEG
ncbi:MAG: helix-turn-helix transcriptional regulator [Eggerthellaceae bacterium]|nr:helix-turn-helix transcriptional regulator [Eggerthellaceae bacterium]MBR0405514.1 helix-turn-helix transcriptional regulator [Eggerthellaceae bacterium]